MNFKAKGLTVEQILCSILFSQDTATLNVCHKHDRLPSPCRTTRTHG